MDRNGSTGLKIFKPGADDVAVQRSLIAQDTHDLRKKMPVVPVLPQEINRALRGGERQDIDTPWRRTLYRLQDARVDPRTHSWRRDAEQRGNVGDLRTRSRPATLVRISSSDRRRPSSPSCSARSWSVMRSSITSTRDMVSAYTEDFQKQSRI